MTSIPQGYTLSTQFKWSGLAALVVSGLMSLLSFMGLGYFLSAHTGWASWTGQALVLGAVLCAGAGIAYGLIADRLQDRRALKAAQVSVVAFGLLMLCANGLMVGSLLGHDFSVSYVAQVGSRSTPTWVTIVSLWSSLEGSILFWGAVLGIYGIGFVAHTRHIHQKYMPSTLACFCVVAAFFASLIAGPANPFSLTDGVIPSDGPGPNPLLQNHLLMAIHPPSLYLGYVGMSIPFSMAIGALIRGELGGAWLKTLRLWTMIAWTFLSIGIILGGWWAYEVLGWGGYWAWDPVENASFLPWLAATAYIHSAVATERRGVLKLWTLFLVITAFLMTLLGTFMTRSGVFNSVHSFTESPIGPVFLVFLAIVAALSLGLLLARSRVLLEMEKVLADKNVGQVLTIAGLVGTLLLTGLFVFDKQALAFVQQYSFVAWLLPTITLLLGVFVTATFVHRRDAYLLLSTQFLFSFLIIVLLGTTYPLLMEAAWSVRLSVGEPFFNFYSLPLGATMIFFMGLGPAIPWGRADSAALWRKQGLAVAIAAFVGAVLWWAGYAQSFFLISVMVCVFAAWLQFDEIFSPALERARRRQEGWGQAWWRYVQGNRRKIGGCIAHLAVVMIALAMSVDQYTRQSIEASLQAGQQVQLGEYTLSFSKSELIQEEHRTRVVANLDVVDAKGARIGSFQPAFNYYATQREPIGTPDVQSQPLKDIYLSLVNISEDGSLIGIKAYILPAVPLIWYSIIILVLGSIVSVWPRQSRMR